MFTLIPGIIVDTLFVLDLFSGIGGFSLGLEKAGMQTIAFCEIEPFCQKVLASHWPQIPITHDIRKLHYREGKLYDTDRIIYEGPVDLICGGFPCQPFSIAGRKKGAEDHRDLWPEMFRIIQQTQPTWVLGENVANFTNMAFTRSKIDLENEGYTVQPFIIPACAVQAPHRRDRIWIVANARNKRRSSGCNHRQERSVLHDENRNATKNQCQRKGRQRRARAPSPIIADNGRKRVQGCLPKSLSRQQTFSWCKDVRRIEDYFNRPNIPQPLIRRNSNGISNRVDRTRALGNSVVPQIPEIIGSAIIQSEYKDQS
ncbi:MAG: DNA cytosine methyltransferase [Opitutaceae bacterium]